MLYKFPLRKLLHTRVYFPTRIKVSSQKRVATRGILPSDFDVGRRWFRTSHWTPRSLAQNTPTAVSDRALAKIGVEALT